MNSLLPLLRSDLVISRQETAEGLLFIIKDPATGRYFKFKEPQYFIASQLDGKTATDTILQRVEEQFGVTLTDEDFQQFIAHLQNLNLLQTKETDSDKDVQNTQQPRLRGNLLYKRFKAFDPDSLLNRMVGKVWFFFTPQFVVLSVVLIVTGLFITFSSWYQIERDMRNLFQFQGLLSAYLIVILIIMAHEFAHGLTCKRFGGEVHEMGFMLIYFQPAFYCNVSDAWLFPEKYKRLWVTFAGAFFEVFLWALATLGWRLTEPGTAINHVLLVVMATSGIKTLFNFNPMIKLDGYYLLSDYLELPNLRERAFSHIANAIKRLWGATVQSVKAVSSRERKIYWLYGLLAGSFSYIFLGYILLYFGSFLTGNYQAAGFILFSGLLAMVFQNQLIAIKQKCSALFKGGNWSIPPLKGPIKIGLLSAVILTALFFWQLELTISGRFTALPFHNADVRAQVEGIIEKVYVQEGDWVQSGDIIARLADREYQAELNKVKARINEKVAKLKMLKAGPREEEVDLARKLVDTENTRLEQARKRYKEMQGLLSKRLARLKIAVRKAKERLQYSENNLKRVKDLWGDKYISRREFEQIEEQTTLRERELEVARAVLREVLADHLGEYNKEVKVAGKELEAAKSKLKVLLAGSRAEVIEATEAEIANLEVQHRYLEGQTQRVLIRSPHAGVIITPKMKQKIGQNVERGELIAKVHELKIIIAEIDISELEIADVKLGQQVVLKARAYPAEDFYGTVLSIAPAAVSDGENTAAAKIIRVTSRIDNGDILLKSQMTGNAKIFCGKRPLLDLVTRRFVRYIRVEFWSWW